MKKMKILLIYPFAETTKILSIYPFGGIVRIRGDIPKKEQEFSLGLLYLASIAESLGHRVSVKFANKSNINSIVKEFKPDVVGITATAFHSPDMLQICEEIKKLDKDIQIILGGYFLTFMFREVLLKNDNIDYVVVGEGEKTFSELLEHLEKGKNPKSIKGLAFKLNGKIFFSGTRELIQDLDTLPFPARHLAPSEFVSASRGCYFNCKFCCIKNFYKRSFRVRSVNNVIEELRLMDEFGYEKAHFIDDCFLWDKRWSDLFFEEVQKNKIDLKLRCMSRPELLDRENIKKLENSNFYMVSVGIHGLSDSHLKYLNTGLSIRKIKIFISNAKKSSIKFKLFYIINTCHPKETENDLWKNFNKLLKLIKGSENFFVDPFIMTPLPGSDIREELKNKKIELDTNWRNYSLNKCTFNYGSLNKKTVDESYIKIIRVLKEKNLLFKN